MVMLRGGIMIRGGVGVGWVWWWGVGSARTMAAAVVPPKPRIGRVAHSTQPDGRLTRGAGLGLGVGQGCRVYGDEKY